MIIFKRRPRTKDTQGIEIERRRAERFDPAEIPSLKNAGLVAGPDIRLVNISRGGAMFETKNHILPGADICIRLMAMDALLFLHGRVLESRASSLSGSDLIYQCRLAFDEEFSLLPAKREDQPSLEKTEDVFAGRNADELNEPWPGLIEQGPNCTLTLTVPVPRMECDLPSAFCL